MLKHRICSIFRRMQYTLRPIKVKTDKKIIVVDLENFDKSVPPDYELFNSLQLVHPDNIKQIEAYFGNPPKKMLKHMKCLKFLQLSSTGFNGYDDKNLYDSFNDVKLSNAKNIYNIPIAEYVVGIMLLLGKYSLANFTNRNLRIEADNSRELANSKVLICGMGSIGKTIASRLSGFDTTVIGIKKNIIPEYDSTKLYTLEQLEMLLPKVDYVISVLPEIPETNQIFNEKTFRMMKSSTIFINVGRGNSVNHNDLYKALREKVIFAAALDATDPYILPRFHKLRRVKRCFISDHTSALSVMNTGRLKELYYDKLNEFFNNDNKERDI